MGVYMFGMYDWHILPQLLRYCACGSKPVRYQRRKVVPDASGVILEVGMGSGENRLLRSRQRKTHLWAGAVRRNAGFGTSLWLKKWTPC